MLVRPRFTERTWFLSPVLLFRRITCWLTWMMVRGMGLVSCSKRRFPSSFGRMFGRFANLEKIQGLEIYGAGCQRGGRGRAMP